MNNTTIVTGIWNLKRDSLDGSWNRPFQHYIDNFIKLLKTDCPMYIYIEAEYEHIVWENRSPNNTHVQLREVDDFKKWFTHYDRVQEIRTNPDWYNQVEWLKDSTQAKLEMYNPIVMSKMFMLNDARISGAFQTDYYIWVDGGITNTVNDGYFTNDKIINKLEKHLDKFSFICFPYDGKREIHGFKYDEIVKCAGSDVEYVARGGIFGGHKDHIYQANALYYDILTRTLSDGFMGTEESIFTIMTYVEPTFFNKHFINNDGLIYTFFEKIKNETIVAEPIYTKPNVQNTSLYIITFNAPEQLKYLLESFEDTDNNFLTKPKKYLLNNSTDDSTLGAYLELCNKYGFEHIKKNNIGICGGRQFIAEHFYQSDSDYMFFFEDDMTLAKKNNTMKCRNGFGTYVPDLYKKSLAVIDKEGLDFLKLSYSEFYGENGVQWAWYNLPPDKRIEYFPDNKNISQYSIKIDVPRTKMNYINSSNDIPYTIGEIYYSNWPQIMTKKGTKEIFLNTKWEYPYEQTWMSHVYSLHKSNSIKAGVLLISPVQHRRIVHYNGDDRREN